MIKLFESGRRILFFPRRWANSVTRWLLGVHSPEGTIRISNTANPEGEKSVGLDLDIGATAGKIRNALSSLGFTAAQRAAVKSIVRDCLDGMSIVWSSGGLVSVSQDWLTAFVENLLPETQADQGPTAPSGTNSLTSGFSGFISDHSATGGTFTAGAPGGTGVKVKLLCRGMDDGENGTLFWREFTWTSDGRLYAIAAEDDTMGVYTDQ